MTGTANQTSALIGALILLAAAPLLADEAPNALEIPVDEQLVDEVAEQIRAQGPIPAPIWDWVDPELQIEVDAAMRALDLADAARRHDLSLVFADVSDPEKPRVAEVNGNEMMYAASLPKIAVLLAAFEQIDKGEMEYDAETRRLLEQMIRRSSNSATTELIHRVGKRNIARILLSARYRLYDPSHGGGLWVGKDYAREGLWRRDPLHNLSHGATAMQVARFYYLLETDQLVSADSSRRMKNILSNSELDHKFVRVLNRINPNARTYRKSGSWRAYHADSVLVKRDGRAYILVVLTHHAEGSAWLASIIEVLDGIIFPKS